MRLHPAMSFILDLCWGKCLIIGLPQDGSRVCPIGGILPQDVASTRLILEGSISRTPVRGGTMKGGCPNVLWRMVAGGRARLKWRRFAEDEEPDESTKEENDR